MWTSTCWSWTSPPACCAVPGRGADKQDCLSARAQRLWPDALVVHRLDMATSGCSLMARGADMQRRLEPRLRGARRWTSAMSPSSPAPARQRPRRGTDRSAASRPTGRTGRCARSTTSRAAPAHPLAGAGPRGERTARGWNWSPSPAAPTSCACTCRPSGHPILGDALYAPPDGAGARAAPAAARQRAAARASRQRRAARLRQPAPF